MLEIAPNSTNDPALVAAEVTAAREALKHGATKEVVERWAAALSQQVEGEVRNGVHTVTVELPGITGSASIVREIVHKLAEAAHADEETIGNLVIMVGEFVDNELEHSLGLTQRGDLDTVQNKPELTLRLSIRISPSPEGLDIQVTSEGPGTIPSIADPDVYEKLSNQFDRVKQLNPNELVLEEPNPNAEAIDPFEESGKGFLIISNILTDGRNGQLRYRRTGEHQHQAVLSETIPKAA